MTDGMVMADKLDIEGHPQDDRFSVIDKPCGYLTFKATGGEGRIGSGSQATVTLAVSNDRMRRGKMS